MLFIYFFDFLQDPFLVISKTVESGIPIPVFKTEVLKNDLSPTWKPVYLSIQQVGSKVSTSFLRRLNLSLLEKFPVLVKIPPAALPWGMHVENQTKFTSQSLRVILIYIYCRHRWCNLYGRVTYFLVSHPSYIC